CQQESYWPTF
nr:immunoglobulin light chain junction region [Macaca mulatta]MPN90866.1 immunoglobulin light chain junction region [Macaca mulatta]MPN91087.1 immunoglobulin light chain junction region [Macaca mulatta]MPN91648.1 immunoglobulin light chain junction region [Macaca mulatta]MPN91905.1 immunoglobulin light chain junction region [Macaca mulatta]